MAGSDNDSIMARMQRGEIPVPECARTLGLTVVAFDPAAGTAELAFAERPEFANPVGNVQGGFLAAMLDDTMGIAVAATLGPGEFAPTLALNVQFHRAARIGALTGRGRVTRRGREICHLAAELEQAGEVVASATATAAIRRMGG